MDWFGDSGSEFVPSPPRSRPASVPAHRRRTGKKKKKKKQRKLHLSDQFVLHEPSFDGSIATTSKMGQPSRRSTRFGKSERPMNSTPYLEPAAPYIGQFDSLGPQPSSEMVSAPAPGFGGSTRDQVAKVYISEQASRANGTDPDVPGPEYNLPGAMDKSVLSVHRTSPAVFFSPAPRTAMNKLTVSMGRGRKHITTMGSVVSAEPSTFCEALLLDRVIGRMFHTHLRLPVDAAVLIAPYSFLDAPFAGQSSCLGESTLRKTEPRFKFGSAKRRTLDIKGGDVPGNKSCFALQNSSNR